MKLLTETQKAFCSQLAEGSQFLALFEFLPDVYFFCKDREGRFIFANQAEARAFGVNEIDDILGKTDYDFFPRDMANQYLEEDRSVMETGVPVDNKPWLVPDQKGQLKWYLSSKMPLYDSSGEVIGITGVMRDLSASGAIFDFYRELSEVLKFVQTHFRHPIEAQKLAKVAGMSISTLERRFRNLFQLSPMQYVVQVRVQAAAQELLKSSKSVGDIAVDCGFYDQSHFNRHFKSVHGVTPLKYRNGR